MPYPTRISRNEMIIGMLTNNHIQSATWSRRTNKITKYCIICNSQTASHKGQQFCNHCQTNTQTYKQQDAEQGDMVTMQFIPKIPHKTKNFTPTGGFLFNARSKDEAEQIKRNRGLIQALKMGETLPEFTPTGEIHRRIQTGDLQAVPRLIPVFDVIQWKSDGIEYEPF